MKRRYAVVDVFTARPLLGNPVAVVLDAHGLKDPQMQALAHWTRLSETTFVLPPRGDDEDYHLRIFTPTGELPFAGHPTLGSAHAVAASGIATPREAQFRQGCGAGVVRVSRRGTAEWALRAPRAGIVPLPGDHLSVLEAALGCTVERSFTPLMIDVGPRWLVADAGVAATVLGLRPDLAALAALERALGVTGVTVFGVHPADADAAFEVRSFAPSSEIPEDPVCGSGNGAVAEFLRTHGRLAPGTAYRATQGRCLQRDGRIAVRLDDDGNIEVGGHCVTVIEGVIEL